MIIVSPQESAGSPRGREGSKKPYARDQNTMQSDKGKPNLFVECHYLSCIFDSLDPSPTRGTYFGGTKRPYNYTLFILNSLGSDKRERFNRCFNSLLRLTASRSLCSNDDKSATINIHSLFMGKFSSTRHTCRIFTKGIVLFALFTV